MTQPTVYTNYSRLVFFSMHVTVFFIYVNFGAPLLNLCIAKVPMFSIRKAIAGLHLYSSSQLAHKGSCTCASVVATAGRCPLAIASLKKALNSSLARIVSKTGSGEALCIS